MSLYLRTSRLPDCHRGMADSARKCKHTSAYLHTRGVHTRSASKAGKRELPGDLERLKAAPWELGRNGPTGTQETQPAGNSLSHQGGKCNPVNLFYILFEQHYICNVWFYFSLQAFLSRVTDYSKSPLPALSLMCDVSY